MPKMEKLRGALALLSLFFTAPVIAQVTILPTAVFLTDGLGIASVDIGNNTDAGQEVRISFDFAYLGNDEEGSLKMVDYDEEAASRYSVDEQIRAFPRSFRLPPGGRQTVRVQVRPLGNKPDGMYWTRAIVTSMAAAEDIEKTTITNGVGTRIQYVFKQNIPVFYRKGEVSTGLRILDVKTDLMSDRIAVYVRLCPTGNAPFNGSVQAVLRNSSGQVITSRHTTAVVYFESLRRLELPFPDAMPDQGLYLLELLYETKRRDIPVSSLVQASPVKYTVLIKIG